MKLNCKGQSTRPPATIIKMLKKVWRMHNVRKTQTQLLLLSNITHSTNVHPLTRDFTICIAITDQDTIIFIWILQDTMTRNIWSKVRCHAMTKNLITSEIQWQGISSNATNTVTKNLVKSLDTTTKIWSETRYNDKKSDQKLPTRSAHSLSLSTAAFILTSSSGVKIMVRTTKFLFRYSNKLVDFLLGPRNNWRFSTFELSFNSQ